MKPLRILHVANRAEKSMGARYYAPQYKFNNGFVRNGHDVLWFSDRDIARASSIIPSQRFGRRACNEKLIRYADNFCPDVVVLCHCDLIENETIGKIKDKHDSLVIQYNIDLLHKDSIKRINGRSGIVDTNFIVSGGKFLNNVSNYNCPARFMPYPVDASIEIYKNHLEDLFKSDVVFAGTKSSIIQKDSLRNRVGDLTASLPGHKITLLDGVYGNKYVRFLGGSKIGLNFSVSIEEKKEAAPAHDDSPHYLYTSDRITQYMGNGLLTFSTSEFSLSEMYGKENIVEISAFEELVEKLKFFLAHDAQRKATARRGYEKIHNEFNEKLVTRYMLEAALGLSFSHDYCWPTQAWKGGA
jgi:Glycosyl transferases group 1